MEVLAALLLPPPSPLRGECVFQDGFYSGGSFLFFVLKRRMALSTITFILRTSHGMNSSFHFWLNIKHLADFPPTSTRFPIDESCLRLY